MLYPPSLRDILLICATNELYKPYWSDDILIELERNLLEENQMSRQQVNRLIGLLRNEDIFGDAIINQTQYNHLVPVMTNHLQDRHVLAAAAISGAKLIVTPNIKDFPEAALEPYAIEVQTPDEFLSGLLLKT